MSPAEALVPECEIALIGTGAAPLIAAAHLLSQGRSVVVLNPDWDFFLEESELPLDPLIPGAGGELDAGALKRSEPEQALAALRPHFPGAVEFWSPGSGSGAGRSAGFHDSGAPHIRQRARLWVSPPAGAGPAFAAEDFYLRALEEGFAPKLLEGVQAASRFPGATARTTVEKGVFVAKSCDFDVNRYRIGLLEFVRERLGPSRLLCAASPIELIEGGLRVGASPLKVTERALVFWTPRLTSWLMGAAKEAEAKRKKGATIGAHWTPVLPRGVRLWEQWTLMSKDAIDPAVIGNYADMVVWAEFEGIPEAGPGKTARRLSVLRSGALQSIEDYLSPRRGAGWADAQSFESVAALCGSLLRWSGFSVRAMRPRASFEWEPKVRPRWKIAGAPLDIEVVGGCEGPLSDVAQVARLACESARAEAPV